MLNLTKQERLVLMCLSFIMLIGSALQYAFKKIPHLNRIVEVVDSDRVFLKVDINTAGLKELVEIPYIGKVRAGQIIEHRRQHGGFQSPERLKDVKGIGPATYKKIAPFIKVRNRL